MQTPLSSRLANIHILLIDPDRELSQLVRRVLKSFGFHSIHITKDGESALQVMRKYPIDLVITDWDMQPMTGIEFINHVRSHKESPNPFIPIIMLTAQAKRWHVEMARDTGITEFLVKPFTAKALCDRIILVIEKPRNFIIARHYKGPDRRRREGELSDDERRQEKENIKLLRYKKEQYEQMRQKDNLALPEEKEIFLIDRDFSLKKKIGVNVMVQEIFSQNAVKEAQRIIFESRNSFLQWVVGDLGEFEDAYKALESQHPMGITLMSEVALRVKGRAGTFGYELASQVAESLYDMLVGVSHIDKRRLMIIRTHIDVMYVIFQRNIQGFGGAIGTELITTLDELCRKYRMPHSGELIIPSLMKKPE